MHKRTIYPSSNNGTAAQCYQLRFVYAGMLRQHIQTQAVLEYQCICNIAEKKKKIGKHFSRADTVRKQEIQGRMARKLKQLLLLSREFLLPQC